MQTVNDNTTIWANETHVPGSERSWLAWVEKTVELFASEGLCIRDADWKPGNEMPLGLDGSMDEDGFSLDEAHDQWKQGTTSQQYLALVLQRRTESRS